MPFHPQILWCVFSRHKYMLLCNYDVIKIRCLTLRHCCWLIVKFYLNLPIVQQLYRKRIQFRAFSYPVSLVFFRLGQFLSLCLVLPNLDTFENYRPVNLSNVCQYEYV